MKRYFLGVAAKYSPRERRQHIFAVGRKRDVAMLEDYLGRHYGGRAVLCKNGRSGLALALMAYLDKGEAVIINGFTCYAVVEAVKAAGLKPVYADITKENLNFDLAKLEAMLRAGSTIPKGIIVQNSLGNPVDMRAIEKLAKRYDLTIIEDLAHSAGVYYPDGREAGTVGAAAVWSFGKDKAIDTTSGGAVVLRHSCKHEIEAPSLAPKPSDALRARFYPLWGAMYRGLTPMRLNGVLMRCLLKLHWVEKSADNRLDLTRKISKFEAKLAFEQLNKLKKKAETPLREFYLVRERDEVLKRLKAAGYYFDGLWYEKPVSPERYYRRVKFPEAECETAVYVAQHIVNIPKYYTKRELAPALQIIKEFQEGQND